MNKIKSPKLTNYNISEIILEIEKKYGQGSVNFFSNNQLVKANYFSSGILSLNYILGSKGFPYGRIIEIFGPESTGKTTIALHAVKAMQQLDKIVAYIDVEHALDLEYVKNIGINLDNLIISQPDSGEQAFSIVESLIKTNKVKLIIIDSVAALVPIAELQADMEDMQMGAQARLMSKALRKISAIASKNETTIIFINQLREKVGTIYGNPETTPGGRALKYFSSIRIDIRKKEDIKNINGQIIASHIQLKIVKNKLAVPFKTTLLKNNYGYGIDIDEDLINFALLNNILIKKASWIYYQDKMLAQGTERLKTYLENNLDIKEKIINDINSLWN